MRKIFYDYECVWQYSMSIILLELQGKEKNLSDLSNKLLIFKTKLFLLSLEVQANDFSNFKFFLIIKILLKQSETHNIQNIIFQL